MKIKFLLTWIVGVACLGGFAETAAAQWVPFALDLREGTRSTRGEEPIAWDAGWAGTDENATVKLSVNGTTLVDGAPGAGTYHWQENQPGTYKFTHITYQNGRAVKRLTATFVREMLDFAETEIQVTGWEGDYDGAAHTVAVTVLEGATVAYALNAEGPWSETAPAVTEVGETRIWVRVSKVGWNDYVTSAVVTIRALVTAQGVPFAWLEEQDLIAGTGFMRADYEEAAEGDIDEDGYAEWQEYLMGTDPWDETSNGDDDADGDGFTRWEEYVAGTDPNDGSTTGQFTASVEIVDGQPKVSWSPDLGAARVYEVVGKERLEEAEWQPADMSQHHFFKVRVRLAE